MAVRVCDPSAGEVGKKDLWLVGAGLVGELWLQ